MATRVGELFVQLGIKADTMTVRDFGKALGDLPASALGAIAAIGGIEFSLMKLVTSTLDATAGYKIFSQVTGKSAQDLQVWENAARRAQVSTDAVRSSFNSLLNTSTKMKLGIAYPDAQALRAYGALGISPQAEPYAVFEQIRKKAPGINRDALRGWLQQIGVSDQMIPLFLMSGKDFGAARGMGTLSESQIDAGYEGGKKIFGAAGSFWKTAQRGLAAGYDFISKNTGPMNAEERRQYDALRFNEKGNQKIEIKPTIHFHSTAPVSRETAEDVGRELKRQITDAYEKITGQ